jgi:HPt (histidine-containing phosphotransfer) domain-containing protein
MNCKEAKSTDNMKGKLYDLSQVKLFLGDDKQQLGNMISIFVSETPLMIQALNDNMQSSNLDEVRFYAHKLKSSIDLFQINGLQQDIRSLEKLAGEKNNVTIIQQYVSDITNTLEVVIEEMQKEV